MNSDNDKKSLVVIIILLCLLAPAAIIGTIRHINNSNNTNIGDENKGHNFIFKDTLYFYQNDVLLGTYKCTTCSIAKSTIDDVNYHTKYYKDGSSIIQPVLNSNYAIFEDNNLVNIYSIPTNSVITTYDSIKTYGIEEKNGIMLIEKNGLWGTFNSINVTNKIDTVYDYLACPNHIVDGKLDMSRLIGKKLGEWVIIDSSGEQLVESARGEIVDFNDKYYITYDNNKYYVFDYDNIEYLEFLDKLDISIIDNYYFILLDDQIVVYTSFDSNPIKNVTIDENINNITYKLNDNKYDVIVDEKVIQSIELDNNI